MPRDEHTVMQDILSKSRVVIAMGWEVLWGSLGGGSDGVIVMVWVRNGSK